MTSLFRSQPPSFAEEQLSSRLSSLSTLPIALPSSFSAQSQNTKPSPALESALQDLSTLKPVTREKLISVLEALVESKDAGAYSANDVDRVVEAEIVTRAVTMIWKEVIKVFVNDALDLEDERTWWGASLNSRRGVGIYLLQTLPHRFLRSIQPFSIPSLNSLHFPSREALFKPLHSSPSSALVSLTSPYTLTRREMLSTQKQLTLARDEAARKVGLLASQAPEWSKEGEASPAELLDESARIYGVLCAVLEVPPPSTRRSRSSTVTPPNQFTPPSFPSALLTVLTSHLPKSHSNLETVLKTHRRPTAITRFWFPLLFLPPALWTASQTILRNKEWMREQFRNAKETIRGFAVQWVWEPLEGIGKTLRGGGEGLGVAPTTVKSDQASLERMVMDLGRDYYHLSGDALEALGEKVKSGDMEEVLRVYEKELQSPLKNALLGSLIRTLLIQVQKTKTDLSISLLSLDHLLRSQQLTFAFVGVAPSVLILYGIGGWLQGVWRGEKRGKAQRRRYFNGLRDIEKLLLTYPKNEEEMTDRDRGLLIVSVSGLRSWATGLGGSREAFLDDLRMVENPKLTRGDKLRVVERIWRCWGTEGKKNGR
ncbi:nuclear control of ATPase protein 2, partial [Tremellales sp. Uapishka_1]